MLTVSNCGVVPCGSWCKEYDSCGVPKDLQGLVEMKLNITKRQFNGRVRPQILAIERLSRKHQMCRHPGKRRMYAVKLARMKWELKKKLEQLDPP